MSPPSTGISLPGPVLMALIQRTMFAITQEESRYSLNGALLLLTPNEIRMVATDGHRLALVGKELEILSSGCCPRKRSFISIFWRTIGWRVFSVLLLSFCMIFSGWAYWSVAQNREIYGFFKGTPTFLGWYTTLVLGLIVYAVGLMLLVALRTMLLFRLAYDHFKGQLQINPFHPDGSAGMDFAGDMAWRMLVVFWLAAIMPLLLIFRDVAAGIAPLVYHIVTPSLVVLVLFITSNAIWSAHSVLEESKEKWIRSLATRLEVETKEFGEWSSQMKRIKELGVEHPTWPLNLVRILTFATSVTVGVMSIMLSIIKFFKG